MSHWAADLIGRPYSKGGEPGAYNCWSLVRHVFETRHGITMPIVAVADALADNVAAIKRAAAVSGWRPADPPARDGDIVLMLNLLGERHVGVMAAANGGLGLLHAVQGAGVCWQTLEEVARHGFREFAFWRLGA